MNEWSNLCRGNWHWPEAIKGWSQITQTYSVHMIYAADLHSIVSFVSHLLLILMLPIKQLQYIAAVGWNAHVFIMSPFQKQGELLPFQLDHHAIVSLSNQPDGCHIRPNPQRTMRRKLKHEKSPVTCFSHGNSNTLHAVTVKLHSGISKCTLWQSRAALCDVAAEVKAGRWQVSGLKN